MAARAGSQATWRCNGFWIRCGSGRSVERAFELARAAVGRSLRGEWGVEPLSPRRRDFLVTRWSRRPIAMDGVWDLANALADDPDIDLAEPALEGPGLEPEPDDEVRLRAPHDGRRRSRRRRRASDCSTSCLWSLDDTNVLEAWDEVPPSGGRRYGSGIVVAHPDTGYTKHPQIWPADPSQRRVLADRGWDFKDGKQSPLDPIKLPFGGHGTSTGSVIMSGDDRPPGSPFVSGTAPKAKLIPYRVANTVVHGDWTAVIQAIDAAAAERAHVISMSLGGPMGSAFLEDAILDAVNAGLVVISAAGNYWPWVIYPAAYSLAIAVAATNCRRTPWGSSASGDAVDFSAPGESVWRAETKKRLFGGSLEYKVNRSNGTSYATATTAGVCALWQAFHTRTKLIDRFGKAGLNDAFRRAVKEGGVRKPPGWQTSKYGKGILDARKLLQSDLPARRDGRRARRALRAAPAPGRRHVDAIAHLLPPGDAPRARAALGRVLGVAGAELDEVLERHGHELVFHALANPALRSTLHRSARPGARRARRARRPALPPIPGVSRGLSDVLGI